MASEWTGQGLCYLAALTEARPGETIVHGFPIGQGPIKGHVYGHAWLERPAPGLAGEFGHVLVRDVTIDLDHSLPAALYYHFGGGIHHRPMKRYTRAEAHQMAALHEIAGPWPDLADPAWQQYVDQVFAALDAAGFSTT